MYGKLFASTFEGSMYGAGSHVFAVWAYIIANADAKGYVELNAKQLAHKIGDDRSRIDAALDYLQQPDDNSRNPAEDGRRIVREGSFLFRVVSFQQYRDMRDLDSKRTYNRDRQRRLRCSNVEQNNMTTQGQQLSMLSHTDTEAEADTEVKEQKQIQAAALLLFPLKDGTSFEVMPDMVADWCEAYPKVSVGDELREMRAWLQANPAKQKTRAGILRFVNSWLSRENDKRQQPGRQQLLPTQPVAQSIGDAEREEYRKQDERSLYDYWQKQPETFKQANPWLGEVPNA